MRKGFVVIGLFCACSPQAEKGPTAAPKEEQKTILGRVDGHPIKAADLESRVQAQIRQFEVAGRKVTPDFRSHTRRALFNFLVDQELIAQQAQRAGLSIDDAALDDAIATFKDRFGSPAGFEKYLKTIQRTQTQWREDHRARLLRDRVLNKMVGDVTVTEQELEAHYGKNLKRFLEREQVRAAQILIKLGVHHGLKAPTTSPSKAAGKAVEDPKRREALKKALSLKTKASRPGAAFGRIARSNSQGSKAKNGGDLGWFARGRQPKVVEDAVFKAEKGQVIGPLESRLGFHIVKVIDRKAARQKTFDEVRAELERDVSRRRRGQARRKALEGLRAAAKIEILEAALGPASLAAVETKAPPSR